MNLKSLFRKDCVAGGILATTVIIVCTSSSRHLEVSSCYCDLNPQNPTFTICGQQGDYYLEISEYDDFSFSQLYNAVVTRTETCDITLNGNDFKNATYYWRFREAGYTDCIAYYPENEEERTITFGNRQEQYMQVFDNKEYTQIPMPDGNMYTLSNVWLRSINDGNYWIDDSPAVWSRNDPDVEYYSEWPVHGVIVRDNVIYTPRGGGHFNSAWVIDGAGLGLYRFHLGNGATMEPLRIHATEEQPFRTEEEYITGNAMYQLDEDDEGNVYFTTTTDLVKNNPYTPTTIRVYSIDLSSPAATSEQGGVIEAQLVEELVFPGNATRHSRHHQVAIKGSIKGRHTAWVTGSNTGSDAGTTIPETYVYRWSFDNPGAQPTVEQSVIKNNYIGNYTPKSDYITVISDRILPLGNTDTFCYHATYYDNGSDPIIYFESAPTICKFVSGGNCEIISDMRDATGCHNAETMPQAVGISTFSVKDNHMLAYGSKNDEGQSTITLASSPDTDLSTFTGVKKLVEVNPSGFSDRLRQSVTVKSLPYQLLVYAGNGGMALYAFDDQYTTGIDSITGDNVDIIYRNGKIYLSKPATSISIYDVSGRVVKSYPDAIDTIPVTSLNSGIYLLTADGIDKPVKIAVK